MARKIRNEIYDSREGGDRLRITGRRQRQGIVEKRCEEGEEDPGDRSVCVENRPENVQMKEKSVRRSRIGHWMGNTDLKKLTEWTESD
jgi:hypothetical protein